MVIPVPLIGRDGINSVEVESDTQSDILYLVIPNPFDETTFKV